MTEGSKGKLIMSNDTWRFWGTIMVQKSCQICFTVYPVLFLGNFLVTPLPMIVTSGNVSRFTCSADADSVFFLVNGTAVNRLLNPDIEVAAVPGMEPRIHTLQIVANEEYNNTRVLCVISNIGEAGVFSNEAVLIIQGKGSFHIASFYLQHIMPATKEYIPTPTFGSISC